ncbi:uncharacterized protein LOC116345401 isoform X2 [Contarinia nasturtii]|nr:uncharacterized protein LOC116345401 isoform X2 [Contarinia nasturtii]
MLHTINDTEENNRIDGNTNENLSMQFISMVQYRKQPILIGSPLDSMFGESDRTSSKMMRLSSCYKSKISGNGRRIADTSLRMRPYFIPERSRTKSENNIEPDSYNGMNYLCSNINAATNFYSDSMNSNSNSMMETCDAYLSSDCGGSNSSHTVYNNGFTTFNCNQVLPNTHFLNSNQYFRPIKCASLTNQLKKCKSLESVRVENIVDGSQPSHEMEFVSTRIQKLKVQE